MKECSKCILPENFQNISFDEKGVCNFCNNYKEFVPKGEKLLIAEFEKAKAKKRPYDALVPISGGKDSTYILYLAKKKYGLNVLTFTYDNGFFSDIALENIKTMVGKLNVDHIFFRHNWELQKKMYKAALINSGEICGVCGLGINGITLKLAADWKIPVILLGHTPLEDNSFSQENIYDYIRLNKILKDSNVSDKEIKQFLIYPKLTFFSIFFKTKTGAFARQINPLFYIENPSDKEMSEILKKEMFWKDKSDAEYSKHFDCLAEPFSNFIREHRFGYSRRVSQLSTMIRREEITREEAFKIYQNDKSSAKPENFELICEKLSLSKDDVNDILNVKLFKYKKYISKSNKLFSKLKSIKDR